MPPDEFVDQFLKDLANPQISDLSMHLKWVFDSTKLKGLSTAEFKMAMESAIDKIPIGELDKLSEKIGFLPGEGLKLRNLIKSKILDIFKLVPHVN